MGGGLESTASVAEGAIFPVFSTRSATSLTIARLLRRVGQCRDCRRVVGLARFVGLAGDRRDRTEAIFPLLWHTRRSIAGTQPD